MFSFVLSESNFDGLMSGIVGQLFPTDASESDTDGLTSSVNGLTSDTVGLTPDTVGLTSDTDRLHQNNGLKHVSFDFSEFFFVEMMKIGDF